MKVDITNPNWLELQRVVSEREAARLLGVGHDTLRRMVARGEGPKKIRISSGRVGYRIADILKVGA